MNIPQEVNERLTKIYKASDDRGDRLPRFVKEFEAIPYESYDDMISDIKNGSVTMEIKGTAPFFVDFACPWSYCSAHATAITHRHT